jgi:hypothetical protein
MSYAKMLGVSVFFFLIFITQVLFPALFLKNACYTAHFSNRKQTHKENN